MSILEQIQELEVKQILALQPEVAMAEVVRLHRKRAELINQYHNQQLVKRAERLMRQNWFRRMIFRRGRRSQMMPKAF